MLKLHLRTPTSRWICVFFHLYLTPKITGLCGSHLYSGLLESQLKVNTDTAGVAGAGGITLPAVIPSEWRQADAVPSELSWPDFDLTPSLFSLPGGPRVQASGQMHAPSQQWSSGGDENLQKWGPEQSSRHPEKMWPQAESTNETLLPLQLWYMSARSSSQGGVTLIYSNILTDWTGSTGEPLESVSRSDPFRTVTVLQKLCWYCGVFLRKLQLYIEIYRCVRLFQANVAFFFLTWSVKK